MHKFKVNGQWVPKIQWKQTDGQTDGQTEASALPPVLMQLVKIETKKITNMFIETEMLMLCNYIFRGIYVHVVPSTVAFNKTVLQEMQICIVDFCNVQ